VAIMLAAVAEPAVSRLAASEQAGSEQAGSEAAGAATVVDKVQAVIETLASQGPLGTVALARAAGLPKTTVRRLCGELVAWGVVTRIDGKYRIGTRLSELALMAPPYRSFADEVQPFATDLFAQLRSPVTVLTLHGTQVRCIATASSPTERAAHVMRGVRAPMHATAGGKVFMAFSPSELFTQVVSRPLVRLTPYTICSAATLARQVHDARRHGFATIRQESRMGHAALAVPFYGQSGRLRGALAVRIPVQATDVSKYERALKAQAESISHAVA
jgi:DNA-binding IclR family transcriptional regulator